MNTKAAVYVRVSSEEQLKGYSLEAQLEACHQYCKDRGYEVVSEYRDGGRTARFSGADDKRDQLKKLIADAQDGLFGVVVVHKLDRFARNRAQSVIHKELLRNIGIPVLSVTEPLDPNNPASIITEGMLEVLAEWYSANLGQEVRKGKTKAAKLGRWQGGSIKYGYDVKDGYHAIDEAEAKHVIAIFETAANGMPLRKIMRFLHDQGIPRKRGGRWSAQCISLLLRDRTYIGEGRFNKKRKQGNRLVKGEPIVVPFPAIVSENLFNKVQARLAENKRRNGGGAKRFYLLQHLGKCGECGGTLRCHTIGKQRYIACGRQITYTDYNCYQPNHWHLDLIEDYVWDEVVDVLHDYRDITTDVLLERFDDASSEREQQIATARQHLDDLKLEKQRILTTVRKGHVTEDEAELQFRAINSDREHWESELSSLQALQADSEADADIFIAQLKGLDKLFDYGGLNLLSPEKQKEVLNTLLHQFVLYRDGRIELRFKLPVNDKQVADTISSLSLHKQTCHEERLVISIEE